MRKIWREEWAARPPKDGIKTQALDKLDTIYIHHTATQVPEPGDPGYKDEYDDVADKVRAIQDFHVDVRGWNDIAYHYLVDDEGNCLAGRNEEWQGAGVAGRNRNAIHIAWIGYDDPSGYAEDVISAVISDFIYRLGRTVKIKSHSDDSPTACPGDYLRSMVEVWRDESFNCLIIPAPWVQDEPLDQTPLPESESPEVPADSRQPITSADDMAVLRIGDQGPDVAGLQGNLAAEGYPPINSQRNDGSWDGIFGPATDGAVRAFQRDAEITVDGIVGPDTWHALGHPYRWPAA